MKCVHCKLDIDGDSMGAGDGTGQMFAHPECWYRNRCNELEMECADLKRSARSPSITITGATMRALEDLLGELGIDQRFNVDEDGGHNFKSLLRYCLARAQKLGVITDALSAEVGAWRAAGKADLHDMQQGVTVGRTAMRHLLEFGTESVEPLKELRNKVIDECVAWMVENMEGNTDVALAMQEGLGEE